jgi:hypothetical protein
VVVVTVVTVVVVAVVEALWEWLWLIERGIWVCFGDVAWPDVPWVLYVILLPAVVDCVAEWLSVSLLTPWRSRVRISM